MLGISPLLGRSFTEQEGQSNGPSVVLLSEGIWRNVFHADPAIVGQTIRVNNQARTVVGIMPRAFRFPESMGHDIEKAVWLPLQPRSCSTIAVIRSTTSLASCALALP
jgi:putative ABC transport system permease protein